MRWLAISSCLAMMLALPHRTIAADRLSVTLSSNVITVAGEVRARVQVNPDDENRVLHVVLDGPLYYASTDKQLDGADAAKTHDIWWQALPPGEYTVTATVDTANGSRLFDRKRLKVVGFTQDSDSDFPPK